MQLWQLHQFFKNNEVFQLTFNAVWNWRTASNVTFAPAAQLQAAFFLDEFCQLQQLPKKPSFRAMPFCKSPNVTLTWNFQGAPKFVLSDWKLVPAPKRTKRSEWNREKWEFSRVTLHEVTQRRVQSLGPSLAPWTCLCWLTMALGKSFQLSAHQSAGFPPVTPPWSTQGSSCNLGRI